MTWQDINLTAGTVRILEKSRGRVIPLSDWAKTELAVWRLKNPPASDADPVISSHSALYKWVAKAKRAVGFVKGEGLQALRRTFLHQLFTSGVNPQLAAKLAGNSLPTIMRHYVDIQTMEASEAANAIDFSKTAAKPTHKPTHAAEKKQQIS